MKYKVMGAGGDLSQDTTLINDEIFLIIVHKHFAFQRPAIRAD